MLINPGSSGFLPDLDPMARPSMSADTFPVVSL